MAHLIAPASRGVAQRLRSTLLDAHAAARREQRVAADAGYLSCPAGLLDSRVAPVLLGKAGRAVTTRNWATVLKLQAALEAG
ncbi:hypothetical protein PQS31_08355 [Luteimonas sp BLCC-B24]|uniref:hypothetical protein n=1 Tax=Luteimonas sp. BLCC-B24 TaxID=3025317 RepID=UPI00234C7122|nr:hypothetical protein [Luteimonas sp. BLCC-B24]MDC7806829.1 hypothetical protein [Luteimonas sp. BLCC-B24]